MKQTIALGSGELIVELIHEGLVCAAVLHYPEHGDRNRICLPKHAIEPVGLTLLAMGKESRKPQRKRHTECGEGLDAPSPWRQAMR